MTTSVRPGAPQQLELAVADARMQIAATLRRSIDSLVESMMASYRDEIPSYAELHEPSMIEEVRRVTRDNVAALLRAAVAGEVPLAPATTAWLQEFGVRRAQQGFPLEAVLRAYQVGTRVAWRFVLDQVASMDLAAGVGSAVLASVSTSILEITAQISQIVADAFTAAERESATRAERTRRDCVDALLRGDTEPALRDRAAAVGIPIGAAHAVCVVVIEGANAEAASRQLAWVLADVRPRGRAPYVDIRTDQVYAIFTASTDVSEAVLLHDVRAVLETVPVPKGVVVQVALGRLEEAQQGIARSYAQAVRTLSVTTPATSGTLVVRSYFEALPELIVAADPRVARDLYDSTVAPLAAADVSDAEDRLVATLQAYLDAQQSSAGAARNLNVHRHTVAARLKRIEELSQRCLSDHRDVLALELGLVAAKVMGVPHAIVARPATGDRRSSSTVLGRVPARIAN